MHLLHCLSETNWTAIAWTVHGQTQWAKRVGNRIRTTTLLHGQKPA